MSNALMWEVRAAGGKQDRLLAWVEHTALPYLRGRASSADVYRSAEERVVVIAHFTGAVSELPDPPEDLLDRPVHQWPFERVASLESEGR